MKSIVNKVYKTNKFFKINLIFAGFFHFLSDFLPVSTLYIYSSDTKNFFFIILVYNFLAFGLQPFIGLFVDKFGKAKQPLCYVSILLIIFGSFLVFNPYLMCILFGLGNAIFHVSFSKDILKESKSSFPLGVFIAPGVLGLGLGFTFLNDILRIAILVLGFIFFALYVIFKQYENNLIYNQFLYKENKITYKPYNLSKNVFILMIILVVVSIFLRGALGKLTPNIDVKYLFLIISGIAFLGKFIGGIINKKLCILVAAFLAALSSFYINNIYGLIFFTLSINILMPLTLDYLRKLLPNLEATSLGLSAFMLLVPNLMFFSIDEEIKKAIFIAFICFHILILITFLIFEIKEKKKNN